MNDKQLQIGDYVMVVKTPQPWDGAGEDPDDRMALIGHIGLVVELDLDEMWKTISGCEEGMTFIRFLILDTEDQIRENMTPQRNIEINALQLVSRPNKPMPQFLVDNSV
jgi:hypothetical protein